jgi:hypothetical protein
MYCLQRSLFINSDYIISQSRTLRSYLEIFKMLDLSTMPERKHNSGNTGYSQHAMIRAFIVKSREHIESIPRLIDYLDGNPILAEMCGFPGGKLPHSSQFYRFNAKTKHSHIENLFYSTNKKLIEQKIVTLDTFIMDSKPVLAASRDNNLKNSDRNLTDKEKKPKRNPEATLCYLAKSPDHSTTFFWGYRNHVIISEEGIALVEKSLPNNISDHEVAKRLINKLKKIYKFKKGVLFIGDAGYDVNALYDFIIGKLKCRAFIPINPRAAIEPHTMGINGRPLCDANLEMASDGQWFDKSRNAIKHKFICPLKASKSFSLNHPQGCPTSNPKFTGYGCTKYYSEPLTARASVPRDSAEYAREYSKRIRVEQYFSRLGLVEAYQTTHYRLNIVKNQMTIAHLTQSLIALAAASINQKEKIRCYRTFASVA